MKKIFSGLLTFCALSACWAFDIGANASSAVLGDLLSGKASFRTLNEFKDKRTVVLYFWTLNCPPCIEGIKDFNALQKTFSGKNVEFISVLCEDISNPKTAARAKQEAAKITAPVFLDSKGELASAFLRPQDRVPVLVVVDMSGRFIWRGRVFNGKAVLDDVLAAKFDVAAAVKRDGFERDLTAALREKNFSRAVVVLDQYSRAFPADMGPVMLQARLLAVELKKEKQALRILDEKIKKIPQAYSLYELKISILMQNRKENSALLDQTYRDMASTIKDNALLLYVARQLLMRPNSEWTVPHAYIVLSEVLKRKDLTVDQRVRSLQTLGNIYYRAGRLDKAVSLLEEAVKLNKDAKLSPMLKTDLDVYRNSLEFSKTL